RRLPRVPAFPYTTLFRSHETMQGTTLDGSRSRDDGAAYLQLVTNLERPFSVTLGARLDDNQRFGTYATYRAGLSARVHGGTRAIDRKSTRLNSSHVKISY